MNHRKAQALRVFSTTFAAGPKLFFSLVFNLQRHAVDTCFRSVRGIVLFYARQGRALFGHHGCFVIACTAAEGATPRKLSG